MIRALVETMVLLAGLSGAACGQVVTTPTNGYPYNATPVTASATGTTAATTATLPAGSVQSTWICGFDIGATATAATTGTATISGVIGGPLSFQEAVGASPVVLRTRHHLLPCVPSAINTAIVVTSAAPGAGGNVSVMAWGYQLGGGLGVFSVPLGSPWSSDFSNSFGR